MAYQIGYGSLPEPHLSPPDMGAAHYALMEEIELVERHLNEIREAQDAWTEFNASFHNLNPPAEIVAAWDRVKPWIDSHAGAAVTELEALQESEYECGAPWK